MTTKATAKDVKKGLVKGTPKPVGGRGGGRGRGVVHATISRGRGAGVKTIAVPVGQPATKPGEELQAMDAGNLKKLCSWLDWHGVKKNNPDPNARELLNKFKAATGQEKRQILDGFRNNQGKLIQWAKEMTITEESAEQTKTGTVADFYFRTIFFVGVILARISMFS